MKTLITLLFIIACAMPATAQHFEWSKAIETGPSLTPTLNAIAFLNDTTVVTGDSNGDLRAWNVNTGKALWRTNAGTHGQPIFEIAIPPGGRNFFAISLRGTTAAFQRLTHGNSVQLFQNDGAHLADIRSVQGIHVRIAFKDRRTLYATGGGQTHEFNVSKPTEPRRRNNQNKEGFQENRHESTILANAHSPNGKHFAVSSMSTTQNAVLKVTLGTARTNTLYESGANHKVNSLAYSAHNLLAAGKQDGAVQLYGAKRVTLIQGLGDRHVTPIQQIDFHPNGRWLAAAHEDGTINLWDTGGQRLITTLRQTQRDPAIDFSPDGNWLVSGGTSGKLHLWRFIDGDVNRDGKINVGDLRAILNNYGKKRNADGTLRRGDVNADGIVNRRDLALVAEIVEGIEGIPAAPMLRRLGLQTWGELKRR